MKLSELCRAAGLTQVGPDVEISGITHDSRKVTPGALYIALPGRTTDGRRFIPNAEAAGAAAIAAPEPVETTLPYIKLVQPRIEMARLASVFYGEPAKSIEIAAVTGTNGKTTTTTLISEMLTAAQICSGLVGTIEERIGKTRRPASFTTPESPALQALFAEMRQAGVTALAMEFSSIGLEEERVAGIDAAVGVFTGLTPDHLDYHGTMAAYAAAKKRLFFERLKAGAVSIINIEDDFGPTLAAELKAANRPVWRVSLEDETAEIHYENLDCSAAGISGTLCTPKGSVEIKSPLIGRFNAQNLAYAAAAALAMNVSPAAISTAASQAFVRGRMQRVSISGGPTAVIDYSHTPDAIDRAIATLKPICHGHLWCVFGCGGDRDATKRPLMGEAAAKADYVILTSDNPRREDPEMIANAAYDGLKSTRPAIAHPALHHTFIELDRKRAIEIALTMAGQQDIVLIAGKGHETYQERNGVRTHFDDLEVAQEVLQNREVTR